MSWFGPSETHGERAARAAQERDRAQHGMRAEEWERRTAYDTERDWMNRNRIHKQSVFQTEREMARREGRAPLYYSPEEVPDLVRPQAPEPELGWSKRDIAIRLGLFAYRKIRERREQAQQSYPQQVWEGAPGQEPGQQFQQGPYPGAPVAYGQKSPATAIVVIWLVTLLGLPIVTGIVGFIAYLVSMGNQSTVLVVNALMMLAQVLGWAVAILATVHLLLAHGANGDPAKLAAAAKWHPLYWPRRLLSRRKG